MVRPQASRANILSTDKRHLSRSDKGCGYAAPARWWKNGDTIALPMPIRGVVANSMRMYRARA